MIEFEIPKLKNVPQTHIEFLKWQVIQYNKTERPDKSGYNCTACKNRRYFARINNAGDFALRPCTCNGIIEQKMKEKQEEEQESGRRKRK